MRSSLSLNYSYSLKSKRAKKLRKKCVPTTRSKTENMTNTEEEIVVETVRSGNLNIENTIPVFEGDSGMPFQMWIEHFENNATVYKWSEQQKYVYARNRMRKSADLFLQAVLVSDYQTLKSVLKKEFKKEYSGAEIHSKLRDRKKKENETMYEYILHMRQIGFLGSVDDKSIIRYIVDGLKGKSEHKIGLYSAKDFKELNEQYEIYERVMKDKYVTQKYDKTINKNVMHCFNCGSKDHKRNECKSEQKCFKCNKSGHISKFCNERKNVNCTWGNDMTKEVVINKQKFKCLIDGGANISLIKNNVFRKHFPTTNLQKCDIEIEGLGGAIVLPQGIFYCEIQLDDIAIQHKVAVVPKSSINYDVIIGFDILKQYRYTSDERGYTFHSIVPTYEREVFQLMNIDANEMQEVNMPQEFHERFDKIKKNYTPRKNAVSPTEMKIYLQKEEPIYATPSRLPLAEQKIVENQIQEWLENGIIRKSSSQYCSRIVLADKKDGNKRVCVDYRRLNRVVLKDRFPVPNMEDIIDNLSGACVYSVLDIKNAFFHVPVEESSKKYLAFVTKNGIYDFNFAPFGFCNSPANFIRFINAIFQKLINENVLQIYMDDIIVYSNDYETNLKKLEKVLQVAEENNLIINWKKCKFLQKRVEFLGLVIQDGTIMPNEDKIRAIKRYPEPRNIKDLQSFLGLVGFFRKFVKNFSLVARPLTNLLKKDVKFCLEAEHKTAIKTLKECLITQPVLKIFSVEAETELHTDASKDGFGAILLQKFDNKWHPVYYYSKKTTDADSKLHSHYLETKAAYIAMKKLRHYLLGLTFTLVTDDMALKYTRDKADLPQSLTRYVNFMEQFVFAVKHRKGVQMKHVDALSRYSVMVINAENDLKFRIAKAQEKDEGLKAIKDLLKKGSYENYKLVGGVLYKQIDGHEVVVAPRYMEKQIILEAHQNGHFGLSKTIHHIKQQYFIPHLEAKIKKVIENCVHCILHNKKQGKQEGFLNIINKGDQPLCTLHIDHLGPLDATCKQYKYIFAMVDGFSKFIWLYPTKSTNAEEVLKKLNDWSTIFGTPRRIISDRGPAFTSGIFKEFCNENNIEHVKITTGVPRGNGQIERVNRTILPVIAKLSAENPQQWYKYVRNVQTAINSNVHRSTKYTPFEILFGVKMNNAKNHDVLNILQNELVEEYTKERENMREEAKQQIIKIQNEYKKTFDKRRKSEQTYNEGDLVAIKRTQFVAGRKLASEYLGPYEVTKIKGMGRYDVTKRGNAEGPIKTSTSSDQMKPWQREVDDYFSSESDEE